MAVNRPAKIGKYDVIDVIGRGGMGIVYKGSDPYLDRLVAIKMMTGQFAENSDLLKRFYREAQSTASLQHPNIVTVFELGDQGGNPYLVMEYLDGESLDSIISSRRQLSTVEKIELMIAICQGLSYAHGRGIVHRDIKPANIMVLSGGGVKIVDFGIAHFGDRNVTRTGQIVGSISYMSPEQVNGRQVDVRTDIFSTGVVLYQLFTYVLPFEGESTASTLLKIINEPPPPLKDFLAAYPPQLQTIVDRALAKDRNERYASAEEFALELGQLQSQLKQELITRYLTEATQLIESNELHRAKGQVLQILKIDRHHTKASHLLRELQEKIQKQEIAEEIQHLRLQAEDAFAQEHFETALEHVERAIALDRQNPELQRLRDTVKAAELRAQKFQRAVRLAESAHQVGDLDLARQTIEEALEIAPDDTHARALQRTIQNDWAERVKQRQLESCLEQARRDLAARKFTAALELLQQARALDPSAPQVRTLMEAAAAAQEQERRRRELEAVNREIEDALNRDDYETATRKADAGLAAFPQERGLLKLKALAEKQRLTAERKRFVDEQLAMASSLLEQGRGEELVERLEAALAKIGGEPRLQSLLLVVRENVERDRLEKRKNEYLQRARESLRGKRHEEAIGILEAAKAELPDAADIDDLLQFAREDAATEKRRRMVDAAAEQARAFLEEHEYERAIQLLETTLREVPDEELISLLGEARHAAREEEKKFESALAVAGKLIESLKAGEAVKLLNAQPPFFARKEAFQALLQTAVTEAERQGRIGQAVQEAQALCANEDYPGAIALLEQCRSAHGATPALENQLLFAQEKRSAGASAAVQKALSEARMLLNAVQYRAALDRLALVAQNLSAAAPGLQTDYENAKHLATQSLAHQRAQEIQRHVAAGEITGAAELLQQTLTEFPGGQELSELETLVGQEMERRSEAQSKVAEARTLFQKGLWGRAADLLKQAFGAARNQPPVREAVLTAFTQGAEAAVEKDWHAAETLVTEALELQETYQSPSSLRERISERKREDEVNQWLERARRLQSAGDLQAAMKEVAGGLLQYPADSRLRQFQETLRGKIQEQERREKEQIQKADFLRRVKERAEQETLDYRTQTLQDALTRYPDDPTLELELTQVRELNARVTQLSDEARSQEEAKRYDEALKRWDAVRTIYPQHPDLDRNIARLRRLSEEELAARKAAHARELEAALGTGDLERAGALLQQGEQQFPGDRVLAELGGRIQTAIKLRAKAQKLLASAEKAFAKSQWDKGLDSLKKSCEAAPDDPVVRKDALAQLQRAFDPALDSGWEYAHILLDCEPLRPDPALLQSLRERVEERKKQQIVSGHLSQASQAQNRGDLENALRHLESGLAAFSDEPQLTRAKAKIEESLLEQERARQEEAERQRELQRRELEEQRRREEAERLRAAAEAKRQEELRRAQQETQLDVELTQDFAAVPPAPTSALTQTFTGPVVEPAPEAAEEPPAPVAEREAATPAPVQLPARKLVRREAPPIPMAAIAVAASLLVAVVAGIWWIKSLPPKVIVSVVTRPEGASIRVANSGQTCETPNCSIRLAPGDYEIEAQLQGYETARKSIAVTAQGANSIEISMIPLPAGQRGQTAAGSAQTVREKPGQLVIRDIPAGSQIFVDGTLKGKANARGTFSAEVPAGEHQVAIVARNEPPKPITRQFPAGGRVELSRPDFKAATSSATGPAVASEDSDWLRVKDSRNAQDVNNFLQRYPAGTHHTEAESRLDDLYWAQAKHSNSAAAIRDYLNRYRQGKHADEAQGEIARLDWQAVENSNDAAAVNDFLNRYPSGQYHDLAAAKADDLLWSRTSRDTAGLNSYLQKLPNGRHAGEARAGLGQVEAQDWAKARASSQQSDIRNFVNKYPNSTHAGEAQALLQELAWTQTNLDDVAALQQYLGGFPSGKHSDEASRRIDDLLWTKVDKRDRNAVLAFVGRRPNSPHRADAQAILDQMTLREAQKKNLQQPLDLFNAAFESQQPKELKEVWPRATSQYLDALHPPAGYKVVLKLLANGEPTITGDTAQIPCELISQTTVPGGQTKQNQKSVKVALYKSGDRWLISDPFGQ